MKYIFDIPDNVDYGVLTCRTNNGYYEYNFDGADLEKLPTAQPEQLEQCPIYGGMCAYPSDQCYDCPRHAGAKMGVTE